MYSSPPTFFRNMVLSIVFELSSPSLSLNWSFMAETGGLTVDFMHPGLIWWCACECAIIYIVSEHMKYHGIVSVPVIQYQWLEWIDRMIKDSEKMTRCNNFRIFMNESNPGRRRRTWHGFIIPLTKLSHLSPHVHGPLQWGHGCHCQLFLIAHV